MKINRLNAIEQYIINQETVSIDELCAVFEVSKNTIRRDLNELEARGHISKVYGGVTVAKDSDVVPLLVRNSINQDGKERIGKIASREVADGDTIFVDSGSTTPCILKHLKNKKKITVVTHSLTAMQEAAKYENLNLISLGGVYNPSTGSFLGLSTLNSLGELKIKKAFMAATGVSINGGMSNMTFLEGELKRGVVERSSSIYLMADTSKIGRDATVSYCRLKDITAFITEACPPEMYLEFFRNHGIQVAWE